ncbi:MAG: hypothetical protein ABI555_00150 [Chloroflexota bacterium]
MTIDGGRSRRRRGFNLRPGHDELEARTAAARALQLNEGQVIPAGKEPHPIGGDGLVADGAGHPVRERALLVAGIHPRGV